MDLSHFDNALSAFDDAAKAATPEEYSPLQSGALGAAQGASFGFADELEAGARSKLLGESTYDKLIKDIRNRYKQAEEQNPKSSFVGSLAGGLALAPIMPAAAGESALATIGALGASGAAYGGLSALGNSTADLTSGNSDAAMQAGKEALSGAALGAGMGLGTGMVTGLLGGAGKYALNKAGKYRAAQDIGEAYKNAAAGESLFGKVGELSEKNRGDYKDLIGKLEGMRKEVGEGMSTVNNIASETHPEIDVATGISKFRNELPDIGTSSRADTEIKQTNDLLSRLTKETPMTTEEVVPGKAKNPFEGLEAPVGLEMPAAMSTPVSFKDVSVTAALRPKVSPVEISKFMNELQAVADNATTAEGRATALQAKAMLKQNAEYLPDQDLNNIMNNLKRDYANVTGAQAKLGLPKQFGTMHEDNIAQGQAINKLQKLFQGHQETGSSEQQIVKEAMDSLGQSFPGMTAEMKDQLYQGARKEYLARQMMQESLLGKPSHLWASGKAKIMGVADLVGQGVSGAKNFIEKSKAAYDASPESLQAFAATLGSLGSPFAKAVSNAANAPQAKRKAIMFTLMQQPGFREMVNQHSNDQLQP